MMIAMYSPQLMGKDQSLRTKQWVSPSRGERDSFG
jgi:hypothetical protein